MDFRRRWKAHPTLRRVPQKMELYSQPHEWQEWEPVSSSIQTLVSNGLPKEDLVDWRRQNYLKSDEKNWQKLETAFLNFRNQNWQTNQRTVHQQAGSQD